jgi:hypothetical protein
LSHGFTKRKIEYGERTAIVVINITSNVWTLRRELTYAEWSRFKATLEPSPVIFPNIEEMHVIKDLSGIEMAFRAIET